MALKFGSPAWQAKYNPRFKKSKSVKQVKRRIKPMAKKRRSVSRSSNGSMGNVAGTAVGVAGYLLFESVVEPKIIAATGVNGMMLNLAEIAVGVYAARKGGVVGNVGKAAVVINLYQLMQPFVANLSS